MELSISEKKLCIYVTKQLNVFFPDCVLSPKGLEKSIRYAVERLRYCFLHIEKPYYNYNGKCIFNHLHGDHYAMFLYLLSNSLYVLENNDILASKVFLLNKALHGLDAFYSIELPKIFIFVHPIGTILGKATYENYFAVYQNCTIGATEEGIYPSFSEGTVCYSKSSIIGKCNVGKNVVFAANSLVINQNISDNRLVLGSFPNNRVIENNKKVLDRLFK